jgi:rare lipoprotein A (peptidoglycan hydrolase)
MALRSATARSNLTKKAAKDIGLTRKEGVAQVKIKVTGTPDGAEATPVR